ncbi:unnamed protein product [Rhizoctonia solani]|uniref:F-box domain-containing protein n=1 Tax=Rhizoctonia solani TaxID=456999 RepID=A0A8H2ZY69_9AGAM|nr:unnamed protein product [Rhizoctonia solani]
MIASISAREMTNDTLGLLTGRTLQLPPPQMLEQLRSAGENLRASIDNYLGVCSILHDSLSKGLSQELAACLEQEFTLISPYEQKIRQARVVIGNARNYCTSVASISKLPPEILIRIFFLVSRNSCRLSSPDDFGYDTSHSRYPDWLAHVCSQWRKIALSSPNLWTHIDLTPGPRYGRGIWDRAHAYIERAGKMPCEIHVDDRGRSNDDCYYVDEVISTLASRSKAFEFTISSHDLQSFHSYVLSNLILECDPEILKTFHLSSDISLPVFLSHSHIDGEEVDYINSDMGYDVLRLSDSQMDAVDLRLTSPSAGDTTIIAEFDLISVLSASPQLRILHFSLDLFIIEGLGDEPISDHSLKPVLLQDLEEIYVSTIYPRVNSRTFHVGFLLRLLAPGSKPLRLTLETTDSAVEPLFGSNAIREFFTRSKVEKLWIRNGTPSMIQLQACHLPDLKVIVFDSSNMRNSFTLGITEDARTWIMHDTILVRSELVWIMDSFPARLVLSHVRVMESANGQFVGEENLRADFPTVEFTERNWSLCPTADWDILDRCVFPND